MTTVTMSDPTETSAIVTEAEQTAAQQYAKLEAGMGEDPTKIGELNVDWAKVLQSGHLISLTIGRWRAETKMSLEDFGLEPKDERERKAWDAVIKSLGSRRLLPAEVTTEHDKLENAARALLERYTQPTFMGRFFIAGKADPERGREEGWRYVEWKSVNDKLRDRYFELRDQLNEKFDEYLDAMRAQVAIIGYENYGRLLAAGAELPDDREEWVKRFVQKAMARVPSKDAVYNSFVFETRLQRVKLAAAMAEDQARAGQIILDREALQAEMAAKNAASWKASEIARAEANAARLVADEEARLQIEMARAKSQMERDLLEQEFKNVRKDLKQFLTDVVADLHSRVYEVCVDVLEALKRNDGDMPTRSVVELRNLVKALDELNVTDLPSIMQQTSLIRLLLRTHSDERLSAHTTGVLEEIGTQARLMLLQVGRPPKRSAREVGIPDTVAEIEFVRRARREAAPAVEAQALPDVSRHGRAEEAA